MNIPKSDVRWRKLVTGELKHQFKVFAASMCVNRNIREILQNNSEENIQKAINEVYDFFTKYEKILAEDIKEIFS